MYSGVFDLGFHYTHAHTRTHTHTHTQINKYSKAIREDMGMFVMVCSRARHWAPTPTPTSINAHAHGFWVGMGAILFS